MSDWKKVIENEKTKRQTYSKTDPTDGSPEQGYRHFPSPIVPAVLWPPPPRPPDRGPRAGAGAPRCWTGCCCSAPLRCGREHVGGRPGWWSRRWLLRAVAQRFGIAGGWGWRTWMRGTGCGSRRELGSRFAAPGRRGPGEVRRGEEGRESWWIGREWFPWWSEPGSGRR